MQARIEEMKAQRIAIIEENERKQTLIQEYRELKIELDNLTEEGMLLDTTINNMMDISSSVIDDELSPVKSPSTIAEFQETKEEIKKMIEAKKEENKRKQALIQEFRKAEEELQRVQNETEQLDSEIESIFNQNSNSKVKKLGEL